MEHSIRDYVSEGTNVSYRQIRERFGTPKQIAETYISEMETRELLTNLKNSRKNVKRFATAIFIMVALWVGYVAVCYLEVEKDVNGYAVVEVVEIDRKTNDGGK